VGAVAGAEPATEFTGIAHGDAAEVSADTEEDEPFGILDTDAVGLGIAEG